MKMIDLLEPSVLNPERSNDTAMKYGISSVERREVFQIGRPGTDTLLNIDWEVDANGLFDAI
jgi:hypothetical protein